MKRYHLCLNDDSSSGGGLEMDYYGSYETLKEAQEAALPFISPNVKHRADCSYIFKTLEDGSLTPVCYMYIPLGNREVSWSFTDPDKERWGYRECRVGLKGTRECNY